jgi:hypothetical protein
MFLQVVQTTFIQYMISSRRWYECSSRRPGVVTGEMGSFTNCHLGIFQIWSLTACPGHDECSRYTAATAGSLPTATWKYLEALDGKNSTTAMRWHFLGIARCILVCMQVPDEKVLSECEEECRNPTHMQASTAAYILKADDPTGCLVWTSRWPAANWNKQDWCDLVGADSQDPFFKRKRRSRSSLYPHVSAIRQIVCTGHCHCKLCSEGIWAIQLTKKGKDEALIFPVLFEPYITHTTLYWTCLLIRASH